MRSLVIPLALLTLAQAPAQPSPVELARRIQAHYDTVQDFQADFSMSYRGPLLRQATVEKGDVKLKKPNRMWWRYTAPDKKEYVADGTRLYQFFPQDKLGYNTALPKAGDASTALLFLAGKGDLVRDFSGVMPPEQPDGEWHLLLTPKTKQPDYETMTLVVDRKTMSLRGLVLKSEEGTQAFTFTRFRANTGLKDTDFNFTFPRGTEVRIQ